MSAPRAAAMVSTSQSMGSQLRPGVNIWWNSSVTPYGLDSAAATMGAHFDSASMGLATSSAPAGPCGFKWKRVAQRCAEHQVFAEVPDGTYIHFVSEQGGGLRGQPLLDRGEDAGVVVDVDTAAAGHEEDERQHGDNGDPGDDARGVALNFISDLRIFRSRSVVRRGLGSVFVSHNASQSSKNVPARRGRAGTFTKGAGVKAPLSQVCPASGACGLAKAARPGRPITADAGR